MKFNVGLIAVGTLLLCFGLYRAYPPKLGKIIFFLAPVSLMFLGMMILLCKSKRFDIIPGTFSDLLTVTGQYIPLLMVLFATMALGGQLVRNVYSADVEKFLTNHGSLGALTAAILTPSSTVASRMVDTLWVKPQLRSQLMIFIMASPLLSCTIFMLRLMGIQTKEVIYKTYGMSALASICMILIVKGWELAFGL
jgi:hypothetical protein